LRLIPFVLLASLVVLAADAHSASLSNSLLVSVAAQTAAGGSTLDFDNRFGAAGTIANALALDAQGNVYVAGESVFSPLIGSTGDIFVNEWNAAGNQLIYSFRFGGNGTDYITGLAVDAGGSAYVIGSTTSPAFPVTSNAIQKTLNGTENAFVAKVSADGTHLVYATLLGGGTERAGGIVVDASGAAYMTGSTSGNFPVTANAFQTTPGATCSVQFGYVNYPATGDAFVAKISPDGGSLIYASYLGGGCGDYGFGIAVNADGTAWVVGETSSPDFPATADALQPAYPGGYSSGFLARVSAAGDRLEYSTFLGGNYATINSIAVDPADNLYLTGSSDGFTQPASVGAYQPEPVGGCYFLSIGPPMFTATGNAFVMKLDPTGTAIGGLTYLGSACSASGAAIAIDTAGAPWIVGSGSGTFPMATPLELQAGGGFISKFSPDLTQLPFSTSFDPVNALAIDAGGTVYVAGWVNNFSATANVAYVAAIDAAPATVSLDNVLSASPFSTFNASAPAQAELLAPGKAIRVVGRSIGPAVKTPGVIAGGVLTTTAAGVEVTFVHCCPRQDRPLARAAENRRLAAAKSAVSGGGLGFERQQPVQVTSAPV